MRRLARRLALGLVIALTGYFLYAAVQVLQQYGMRPLLSPQLLTGVAIMALCYGLAIPISAWAWRILLADLGQPRPLVELMSILAISQFAKYVPGNIAHVAGRSALSLMRGIPASSLAVTVATEMLLASLAAVTVGVLCLGLSSETTRLPVGLDAGWLGMAAVGGILAVMWLPRLWPALVERVRPRTGENRSRAGLKLRRSSLILALALYSGNYLLIGWGALMLGQAMTGAFDADYWSVTGAFSLAWLVGFLTPGAPAGLGVREGAMTLLLSNGNGPQAVLIFVVAARLATLAADLFWFVAGFVGLRQTRTGGNP